MINGDITEPKLFLGPQPSAYSSTNQEVNEGSDGTLGQRMVDSVIKLVKNEEHQYNEDLKAWLLSYELCTKKISPFVKDMQSQYDLMLSLFADIYSEKYWASLPKNLQEQYSKNFEVIKNQIDDVFENPLKMSVSKKFYNMFFGGTAAVRAKMICILKDKLKEIINAINACKQIDQNDIDKVDYKLRYSLDAAQNNVYHILSFHRLQKEIKKKILVLRFKHAIIKSSLKIVEYIVKGLAVVIDGVNYGVLYAKNKLTSAQEVFVRKIKAMHEAMLPIYKCVGELLKIAQMCMLVAGTALSDAVKGKGFHLTRIRQNELSSLCDKFRRNYGFIGVDAGHLNDGSEQVDECFSVFSNDVVRSAQKERDIGDSQGAISNHDPSLSDDKCKYQMG